MKSDAPTRPRITLIPNNPNLEEVICEVGEPTIRFHLPTRAMYLDLTTGIPIVEIYGSSYLADEETEKHPSRTPLEQVDCQVLEDDQAGNNKSYFDSRLVPLTKSSFLFIKLITSF